MELIFYGIYHYAADTNARKIFDNIFNSVFLFLNTFFCIIIIINICLRKEEIEKEMASEDYSEHDLKRIILIFIANSIIYVESFLIIHDKMPVNDDYIDLVYIITCLLINLIYAINKIVIRETKRIFCKKLFQKKIQTNFFNIYFHYLYYLLKYNYITINIIFAFMLFILINLSLFFNFY